MSSPVKTYRVYCYDAAHHAVSADFIQASNDEEAVAKAKAAGFGSRCEVWDGRRMVAKLDADRLQA